MIVKVNEKIIKLETEATFEELLKSIPKPHLCKKCVSACVGGRNLKNAVIKQAARVRDGLYVLDCEDYIEGPEYEPISEVERTSEGYYHTLHPNVTHALLLRNR